MLPIPTMSASNLSRVHNARKLRATFDLSIESIGTIRLCRLLIDNGRAYVLGPSIRDEYRGWFKVVDLDEDAARAALEAVLRGYLPEDFGSTCEELGIIP